MSTFIHRTCMNFISLFRWETANYQSIFGIVVGTGVGAALSYKKEIIEGANQIAGDWGHQPLPYPTKEEIETKINYCHVIYSFSLTIYIF